MVCIYCGSPTRVTNSRKQKRQVGTWRRRLCTSCGALFTTHEQASLEGGFRFQKQNGDLEPFLRDNVFISIHDSCKHRNTALTDATALTDTVIRSILALPTVDTGIITRAQLLAIISQVLRQFDAAALAYFSAYHKL